jgi:hypothetical protein
VAIIQISIDRARAGQTIARAVSNASGVILVQPGTALTSSLIDRLAGFGVTQLHVQDGESSAARPPEERVAEVRARFAGHEQDALMMELLDIVVGQIGGSSGASR